MTERGPERDNVLRAAGLLYAEDLPVGQVFDLGSHHVTEQEILDFARRWDPLPVHTDPEAAARTRFGGIIGSGIHSMAIVQRLAVDALFHRVAVVAGRHLRDMRLLRPLRPGLTVHASVEIADLDLSRPRTAQMTTVSTLSDAHGPMLTLELDVVVERRPR